jgi:TusA-related sulfurtransferase
LFSGMWWGIQSPKMRCGSYCAFMIISTDPRYSKKLPSYVLQACIVKVTEVSKQTLCLYLAYLQSNDDADAQLTHVSYTSQVPRWRENEVKEICTSTTAEYRSTTTTVAQRSKRPQYPSCSSAKTSHSGTSCPFPFVRLSIKLRCRHVHRALGLHG